MIWTVKKLIEELTKIQNKEAEIYILNGKGQTCSLEIDQVLGFNDEVEEVIFYKGSKII